MIARATSQITFRLSEELASQLDQQLEKEQELSPGTLLTRSDVARAALIRGLAVTRKGRRGNR